MSAQSELERLIRTDVLDGVDEWPVQKVRELRDACRSSEVRISYERRVAQGRLDIAKAEQQRRTQQTSRDRDTSEGADSATGDLVDALPGILADRPSGAPKSDRAVAFIDLESEDVDDIPGLLDLPDLSDGDLVNLISTLQDGERQLSEQRRLLLDNLDRLQDQLVVRYREGRADVGDVVDTDRQPPG